LSRFFGEWAERQSSHAAIQTRWRMQVVDRELVRWVVLLVTRSSTAFARPGCPAGPWR